MRRISLYIILLLWISLGCDNTIDPLNENKGTYSIYGYLNISEDVNYIRVKDLNSSLFSDSADRIDAKVTLQNLEDGTSQILQDTVVEFDGVKTHNFRTTMDLQYDTKYRVSVERSDGATVTATTTTPYRAETNARPNSIECDRPLEVSLNPVRELFALNIEIGFRYDAKMYWYEADNLFQINGNRVSAVFTPQSILNAVFEPFSVVCEDLSEKEFRVRYTHYGPNIYKDASSDSLNIPGGTGRFGAFYKDSFTFRVTS